MTTDAFVAHLRRRWWIVGLQALLAAVVVVAVSAVTTKTSHSYTAEFVMHPAAGTPTGDVANLAQELDASGPVVQTVLRVLSTPGMMARAAQQSDVADTIPYSLSASVSPGTTVFDATITGPDPATLQKLGDALEEVAPVYVAATYHGYSFDLLGNALGTKKGFPPRTDVVLLALLLGAVLGVAEVFVEFTFFQRKAKVASQVPAPGAPPAASAVHDYDFAAAVAVNANGNGNGDGVRRDAAPRDGAALDGNRQADGPRPKPVPAKKRPSRAAARQRAQQQGPSPR
jgi:hypothetical protein